ncbi:hypothetical protein CCR75_006388 [Bremia lactucae]|uniref:UBC core domain-containing protein n=1 Tax=Bremia lactucae TaxID=4779 RepID=A0A976NYR3_BRELC|nr:hypothetical protein CCR75_006388 [Bremia lactucae]
MNTNVKRLRKELQELRKNPEEDMVLYPEEDTIMRWKAFIRGPLDTPFQDRCFELAIQTTSLYPMEPPKMKFITKIFHPNVHFKAACLAVISLLSDPAADSPLNCDAGNMIRAGDMLAYNSMAEMYKKEYGLLELPKDPL